MTSTGNDDNVPFFVHVVHKPICVVNASAPRLTMLQHFRLADTVRRTMTLNILQQLIDAFDHLSILLAPRQVVIPRDR